VSVLARVPAFDRLFLVRVLDDEAVVFDQTSGDTHLLSAPAVSLLQRLDDGARGRAELEAGSKLPPGEFESLVERLAQLGMIEVCGS